MKTIIKMTGRTIRSFAGRYIALALIVALSVGFFAGLKVSTDAMLNTGEDYFNEQNLYDFRLFSTIGFEKEDTDLFAELEGVEFAEGTYSIDALVTHDGSDHPYKLYAITEKINIPRLTKGRMPSAENECLADEDVYTEDDIGKTVSLSSENAEDVDENLKNNEYTIVGLANSPLHIGLDNGSTDIGNGSVYGFLYLPAENFTSKVYTEVNISLNETAEIYSDEYDALTEKYEEEVTVLCERLVQTRYENILSESNMTSEEASQYGIEEPTVYVLTRNENAGYVSYENDTGIIGDVANIFPMFFIMIAILVCVTTMSRMVDEERTQIGVLKAMGYGNREIMGKYLLYAGSATVVGWIIGFFICTWGFPKIFWMAYNQIYGFSSIKYLFSPYLAWLTLVVSLAFMLGSAYFSCRKELSGVPASLIRPRTAKNGKRVLLERLTPLWKRLTFLQKITVRNMFRYKLRLCMMLLGISCCAALIVTAFGVRDSMIDVGEIQYGDIQKQNIEANYSDESESAVMTALSENDNISGYLTVNMSSVDVESDSVMSGVNLLSIDADEKYTDFWDFHSGDESLALPDKTYALISPKVAERLSVSVGDSITLRNNDMKMGTVTVSGIFDNHIYDYVVVSKETYTELFGEWTTNTALILTDSPDETAKQLTETKLFSSITQTETVKTNITSSLKSLNYLIWVIVFFSGALAFIVIYNLTNINIAERSREIATVQVLGFYPKETNSYVLRENLILSIIASILGMPLGRLFQTTVMSMVRIDMITFNDFVSPISYVAAFACSVLFAVIVNSFMKRRVDKINMAESLKAVE